MLLASFSCVRRLLILCCGLAAATLLAQTPSLDGFDPNVDGNVFVMATQADGKVLIGGQFGAVAGVPRNNLARLNADGSLDAAFNPNANGAVRALVLQPDGRIVIGGDFTSLQPNGGAAVARGCLARINADGSVDAGLAYTVTGTPIRAQVLALALQADGAIVVGGSFTNVAPSGVTTPFNRKNLFRIAPGGGLDLGFDPNPDAMVLALAMHVDNKVVVAGAFRTLWPAGDAVPSTRNRIARLNPSGTVDSQFNPNANNGVTSLAVQRDGKIVLGGFFTTLQPLGEESPNNRPHLARLNPSGTIDSEFYPHAEGDVHAIALQPDGSILIGGTFSSVWGRGSNSVARSNVARFNPDGSLDAGFGPAVNGQVAAFAFQADGKVVIGGYFTRAQPVGSTTPLIRNHVARLNSDGSFDAGFALDAGGRILASVTQTDGKVVIGGTFTSVGGATHNFVARLNADGTVDPTYNPDFNGRVYTMAYEAGSNKVIVGGAFTTIGGETRNHLARLNPNGTIDSEYNPNIDGQVGVLLLQSDGKLLVGGSFTSVQPLGASAASVRDNLLRLNPNGTLDTPFHPNPNSSITAIALQSDGKILVGGLFSAFTDDVDLTPVTTTTGTTTTTTIPTGTTTTRGFVARLGSDGRLDTAFKPILNAQVSAIAVQSDGKVIIGGAFTTTIGSDGTLSTVTSATGVTSQVAPPRSHIARLSAEGNLDTTYDPNANGAVVVMALQQSDGKLLIGGTFTTLQPNGRTGFLLRKYAARLNTDGTVDETFNLDLSELPGNRVDSLRIQADGRVLVGGAFASLQPANTPARIARANFVRLNSNLTVDTAFDPGTGGSTSAVVNGFAIQSDNKIVAVGNFGDLGGAKSTNIARFLPEGAPDPEFSNAIFTDGPLNAVAVRPNAAPVASQLSGFAWLNANGTLRTGFVGNARLSGEISAMAVDSLGRVLLGGTFTNLDNTTGSNLVRFDSRGQLDTSFNPRPNGKVSGIAVQRDGRIVVVGTFTLIGDTVRNRIARIDDNGSLDVTFDPNASGPINAIVIEADNRMIVGGAFTGFTPNASTTTIARNNLARIEFSGTVDASYDPNVNAGVNALALQADGKVVAGGSFFSVQPNGGTTAFARNNLVRFNTDGSLDQNFDPNPNGPVAALVALSSGQFIVGGSFTQFQPNPSAAISLRNNLARINSDGAVDATFNPNANAAVTSLALQPNGTVIVGGSFTTLQPVASAPAITRNHLARLSPNGTLDIDFNPDVNGTINTVFAQADGTVLVGGRFTDLELIGSIVVGGNFGSIGGVAARNLAMLNENGSVNTGFQPRPDGPVNAILVQPDGKMVVGGAFTSIAGATRARLARFNADGSLDTAFNPPGDSVVLALGLLPDGKIIVGGRSAGTAAAGSLVRLNANGTVDATFPTASLGVGVSALAVQADGKIVVIREGSGVRNMLARLNADGTQDAGFTGFVSPSGPIDALALQADGRLIVGGDFSTGLSTTARLVRLETNGTIDGSFNPAPNGRVTALALQSDGRLVIGGGFNAVGGQSRVGIARITNTGPATQSLGVAANRSSITWTRGGTTGEIAAATFEVSSDRATWTTLGNGTRVAGTSNWQITGLNLPGNGLFYVRARGLVPTSTSSGVYESVREFTFTNPIPTLSSGPVVVAPQTSASQLFDPATGITPRAAISVVPGEGTVEIFVANLGQGDANARPARLANLSTRGRVSADNPLILGFAIAGTEQRRVLVRAVGPALSAFGVSGALAATRLQVYDSTGTVLATNEGWNNSADVAQAGVATGAFPLTAGSADSAAVLTLAPGNYTLQVVDTRGSGGVGLAEIYDAGTGDGARLVNVSSRGAAGTGANALISGFVIAGDASQRVLLRGVGPGLARFGATAVVADPTVSLFDSAGLELGSNDNWVSSLTTVSAAAASSGAFALDPGSKDAAVLATLPGGAYTIQVRSNSGTTGNALLEIYEVR